MVPSHPVSYHSIPASPRTGWYEMGLTTPGFFLTLSPGVAGCQQVSFRSRTSRFSPVQRVDAIFDAHPRSGSVRTERREERKGLSNLLSTAPPKGAHPASRLCAA